MDFTFPPLEAGRQKLFPWDGSLRSALFPRKEFLAPCRELRHIPGIANVLESKSSAGDSAFSAAYPLQGIKRTAGSHPCKGYAAEKAWTGHERLKRGSLCDTRPTGLVRLSLHCS